MPKFFIDDAGNRFTFDITKAEVKIGRVPECDIVLKSQSVSRLHTKVTKEGPYFFIEDLGSTNGTFVNGKKVASKIPIAHGDRIDIGQGRMEFFDEEDAMLDEAAARMASNFQNYSGVFAEQNPQPPGEVIAALVEGLETAFGHLENLNSKIPETTAGTKALKQALGSIADGIASVKDKYKNYRAPETKEAPAPRPEPSPGAHDADGPGGDGARQKYELALKEIQGIISGVDDYKKASGFILNAAMKILDTNRGFIVMKDPMIGSIVPLVSKIHNSEINEGTPSMIVAKYVVENQQPVLVDDPMLDPRFMSMSESIISGVIKSVICVPLAKNSICLGAIYLDNTVAKKNFSGSDSEFVAKLAECVSGMLEKKGLFGELLDEYDDIKTKNERRDFYSALLEEISTRLVAEGMASGEEIERLRAAVARDCKSPLVCALEENILSGEKIGEFAELCGFQKADLSSQRARAENLLEIPLDYAFSRCAAPFNVMRSTKEMSLAMADPFDRFTVDEIKAQTGFKVRPCYCDKASIVAYLEKMR